MPQFSRYIGVDYSGAKTPDSSCRGLRVYTAENTNEPIQIQPSPSPRWYWTRRGLAEWLCNELGSETPTIVGIDHAFSFPLAYFEKYRLSSNWENFLVDFQHHWPTDARNTYVSFIRDGNAGQGRKRTGERSWLRLTEQWTPTAKSVSDSAFKGRLPHRRTLVFRGCSISGKSVVVLYTSGLLTGGRFRRALPPSWRSTRRCGYDGFRRTDVIQTNKLRTPLRHGSNEPT